MATRVEARTSMNPLDYDYSSFFYSSSDDPFSILEPYNEWFNQAVPEGYYLFAQAMSTPPSGTVDLTEGLAPRSRQARQSILLQLSRPLLSP